MDDIKLFAPNDNCLQQLVDTVREFSDDIKMSFGFEKYAKLSVKDGRPVAAGPVFTLGDEIGELDIPQLGNCARGFWRSILHGQFKVMATNVFCIPLLSCSFGIVEW